MHPTTPAPVWDPAPVKPRRKSHIFRWVFLGIQALFLVWIIAGAHGAHVDSVARCANQTALSAQDCQSASDAGTAIGVGVIIALWAAVDIIVGITYAVVRLNSRQR